MLTTVCGITGLAMKLSRKFPCKSTVTTESSEKPVASTKKWPTKATRSRSKQKVMICLRCVKIHLAMLYMLHATAKQVSHMAII